MFFSGSEAVLSALRSEELNSPVLFSVNYHGKARQLGEFSLPDQFRAVKRGCKFNNVLFMKLEILRMTHMGNIDKIVDTETKRRHI